VNKEQHSITYSANINNHIYKIIPNNKKILDVGCNTGNLGEKLIKNKNCEVWGIDYSKRVVGIAKKRLNKAIFFDIESYKIPFKNEKFDIIIFGDILEHLRYPEDILKKYSQLLNEDGLIIASIPNVASIKVRLKLLFGNWNYKLGGILDKTHLRFFTKKTIKELFENSGYKIIKMDSTPGFIFKYSNILKKMAEFLCKIYPKLFALQFIITAKKR